MLDDKDIEKLGEVFATKEDLKQEIEKLVTKDELLEFKNEILTGQDQILTELKSLSQEKTMEDAQDKRRANVLKIHDDALRRGKILSEGEVVELNKLGSIN